MTSPNICYTPKILRSLKEIIDDDRIYLHAKYYKKEALSIPTSKDPQALVSFVDCPARNLNKRKNPYAEVSEEIYLCDLMDCVRHMYGEEFNRSSAFCLRNLSYGCCPHGFANPLSLGRDIS